MNHLKIHSISLPLILLCLVAGCSRTMHPESFIVYPPPPDTARIQFLTKISNSTDISGNRSWFFNLLFGKDEGLPIVKPYGMAVNKGMIFVCDKKAGGLVIIDLEKSIFDYFIPTGKGQLKMPVSCATDTNGFLYVADAGRFQVVVFDNKGNYVNSFGDTASFKPTDVFIYGDTIWVANMAGHKIEVYSKDPGNSRLFSFTESGPGKGDYLYSPTNVFVNEKEVYVTDFGDFKIKVFSHDGKLLDTLGTYGINMGQLAKPKGVAVDHESNIYVVDAAFENVQIFNKEKRLLMFFGGHYNGRGGLWLPAEIIVDYNHIKYFQKYVDPRFNLKYLIFVTNQFGPDKINVYGRVELKK